MATSAKAVAKTTSRAIAGTATQRPTTSPVLIDTCGWIDFLRGTPSGLADAVEFLIQHDLARLCGVTVAELLHGARGAKEERQLALLFAQVPVLDIRAADWPAAGRLLQQQRAAGHAIPVTDALIATVAQRNKLPVLTVDAHFERLGVRLV